MKILNDIIQGFASTEELLGAYLEGNLSVNEESQVEALLGNNLELSDLANEICNDLNETNFGSSGLYINELDLDQCDPNDILEINNFQNSFFMEPFKSHDSSTEALARMTWGEGGNGNDPWLDPLICQGNEGVCAIRSQQIILRDYGVDIPLETLKEFAINQGWYDPSGEGGTPMICTGYILEACGLEVEQKLNGTVYDLVNELAQGHRVIVGVDAEELWADREGNIFKQTKQYFNDIFNGEAANHALIVAGVEVNPANPNDVKVILTDPGTGDLRIEYSLDDFMDAWEDSDCFMVSTTTPAPLQYDAMNRCMIPSNFAFEQFVDANTIPLIPDEFYPMPSVADAYYADGHINHVGHNDLGQEISYSQFSEKYKEFLGNPMTFGQDHFDKDAFVSALKSLFGQGETTGTVGQKVGNGLNGNNSTNHHGTSGQYPDDDDNNDDNNDDDDDDDNDDDDDDDITF